MLLGGVLAVGLLLFATLPEWFPRAAEPGPPPAARTPVRHVVEIMMENHGFDNYFGTFPGVLGLPADVRLPDGSGASVGPYWINGTSTPDLPHDRPSEIADVDGGAMDGFVEQMAAYNRSLEATPMGYYNATQIPGYWALAGTYVLCDHYFASVLGPTVPNRLYAIAGSSAGLDSDAMPAAGVDLPTIFDQLSNAGLSWRYYYDAEGNETPIVLDVAPLRQSPSEVANVAPDTDLLSELAQSPLANVTYIDPEASPTVSEHPPENVTVGQDWTLSVLATIEANPDWPSTAIFLTWDEGGGYYDSVAPPAIDALGYGLRVPLLIVSPFTRGGGVDSSVLDHTSILRFIDEDWGLPALNARVAEAGNLTPLFASGLSSPQTGRAPADPPPASGPAVPTVSRVSVLAAGDRPPPRPRSPRRLVRSPRGRGATRSPCPRS